jgi:AraC-like DNA-binding protein
MFRYAPAPLDLQAWIQGAVVVNTGPQLAETRFPAMVSGMLVIRLAGRVHCGGTQVPPAALITASTSATVYAHPSGCHAVGLILQPAATASLFAIQPRLVNTIWPLAAVAGPAWIGIDDKLAGAPSDSARIEVLLETLRNSCTEQSIEDCQRRNALVNVALQARGSAMKTSLRQFERSFMEAFGMTAKRYQVISRMNRTLQRAMASPTLEGAELALDEGYYDQSHLARDMRRFTGRPLQDLVRGSATDATEHWPLQVGAQSTYAVAPDRSF